MVKLIDTPTILTREFQLLHTFAPVQYQVVYLLNEYEYPLSSAPILDQHENEWSTEMPVMYR